ncbi:MAG: 50S ribosome-binding GTPase [Planctomycetaceae bacterium]|nr:50S ribosome-binding GTPase [Planctomycetaceae bacterium]
MGKESWEYVQAMNFEIRDVIAALASPAGAAARAIVRVSGDGSREAVAAIFAADDAANWNDLKVAFRHTGRLRLAELNVELPTAAHVWPTNRSYTGEPLVELHLPGSTPLVEETLAALYGNGVRPARPGEFTLRAFLAGRLDLVQAEAVLGVIDAHDHRELDVALRQLAGGVSGRLADVRRDLLSLLADLEAGLDFVDEDIEFVNRDEVRRRSVLAKEAIAALLTDVAERSRDAGRHRVVLAGLPNAGKSTLFNALCGGERAIVSPVAGTTRDWLTAEVTLSGVPIELVDTAGWETAADDLSLAMQSLRAEQLDRADLIVWCTASDAFTGPASEDARLWAQLGTLHSKAIFILTKGDLAEGRDRVITRDEMSVSALSGDGLAELSDRIAAELDRERAGARQLVGSTVARGRQSLKAAHDALERSLVAADLGFGDDVIAAETRSSLDGLAAVLGVVYTDDVLDVIFSRFCIGK